MKSNARILKSLLRNRKFREYILKYFTGAAAVMLIAFTLFVVSSYSMYTVFLRDALTRFREQNLIKTSGFADYVFDGIEQDFLLISSSENIAKVLAAPASALPDSGTAMPGGGEETLIRKSDISRAIDELFRVAVLSPSLDSIYIYSHVNGHVVSWTDFRPLEDFYNPVFVDIYNNGLTFYAMEKPGQDGELIITMVREARYNGGAAVAAFNIRYDMFTSLGGQSFDSLPEALCMADNGGHIFYATDAALLNTDVSRHPVYGGAYTRAMQDGGSAQFSSGRVITSVRSASGRYTVISVTENSEIADFQKIFTRFVLLGSLIGLLVTFMLVFAVSFRLYLNTIRLISLSGLSGGQSKADLSEISYITENIISLAALNSHIGYELAEKLAELKKAQSIALQTQINPHFILNVLQIASLEIMGQVKADSKATRIIAILSDILQSNLNTTDYIVPLSYEIRQAVKYLEIERIRNQGRFLVDWDIDEALHGHRTVKFILQPVLENSFKYGLMNSAEQNKRISISARQDGQALVIIVGDNGMGIAADTLSELQKNLEQSHIQENRNIGLCNVDKRIKLVFGSSFGVSIASEMGRGTQVTIRQKIV